MAYFGNKAVDTSGAGMPGGGIAAIRCQCNDNGFLQSIFGYFYTVHGESHPKMAIYSDNNGLPHALLTHTSVQIVNWDIAGVRWVEFTPIDNIGLIGGFYYWIALLPDIIEEGSDTCNYYYSTGIEKHKDIGTSTFPAIFPVDAYNVNKYACFYATYEKKTVNKKASILDALVVQLGNLPAITKATRILLPPAEARKWSPYAGLIASTEEVVVEDATNVRYELDVSLILLKKGRDIEKMLDTVKVLLYYDSLAVSIGALQIRIIGQEEVALIDSDSYSSTRIVMTITYVAEKGAF